MTGAFRNPALVGTALLVLLANVEARAACPTGTLWEPYAGTCAPVRDVRDEFMPPPDLKVAVYESAPVPGSMSAGAAYAPGFLAANDSGRLHTRMFVYPDGLERDAPLPAWLYTTATSRVDNGLELLAMYSEDEQQGHLGLFAWPCLPDFPCPNGAKAPAWQWSRPLPELACNITHVVDQGGHAHQQVYYANHSDRLDSGSPPLWRSAVYLWDYCDEAWDLAWEHTYRQDKEDCSVPGATCAWWGPSIEIFGVSMYPRIGELGYEDSLLYHDGTWSLMAPPEVEFRDPANPSWGSQTPWQLFHLEPNRSYGLGNWFNTNDAPVIEAQDELFTEGGQPLPLDTSMLTIDDPDVDPAYHAEFELTVYGGSNYVYDDGWLTPDAGFSGTLIVPISVSDGAAESPTFDLRVAVGDTTEPPVIVGQQSLETPEDHSIVLGIESLVVDYPGGDLANLVMTIYDGQNYSHTGASITPARNFAGVLDVPVSVGDGTFESNIYELSIEVTAINDPPSIDGQLLIVTMERTPVAITPADLVLSDPDNAIAELSVRVLDDASYERNGNTITPVPGVVGEVIVNVVATDGDLDSDIFPLVVQVNADTTPPQIVLSGSVSVVIRVGASYVDAGASAVDNIDGDITGSIITDNPVDTSRAAIYTVTYRVADYAGNTAMATRTVTVEAAAPVTRNSGGGAVSVWTFVALLVLVFRATPGATPWRTVRVPGCRAAR